jgi:phosphoribosylformylglycinamidine synthase
VVEEVAGLPGSRFQAEGDAVLLAGPAARDAAGSEYEEAVLGTLRGDAPPLDLDLEGRLQDLVRELVAARRVRSAHDCSDGGLAVALVECCAGEEGVFGLDAAGAEAADAAALFGEAPSRVVLSCALGEVEGVLAACTAADVPAARLGNVGPRGGRFRLGPAIDVPASDLAAIRESAIPALMEGPAAGAPPASAPAAASASGQSTRSGSGPGGAA